MNRMDAIWSDYEGRIRYRAERCAEANRAFFARLNARTAKLGGTTEEITRRVERESLQALWSKS